MEIDDDANEARALVRYARRNGVALWVKDNRIHFRAPQDGVPAGLLEDLGARSDELIGELSRPVFRRRESRPELLRFPPIWLEFWREVEDNISLASQTHVIFKLDGSVTEKRLHAAFAAVADRHEVLGCRAVLQDGTPCLIFDRPRDALLEVVDVSSDPPGSRTDAVASRIERLIWSRSDDGAVFRGCAVRVAPREVFVAFVLNHFVGDFFSCEILTRDLMSEISGKPARDGGHISRPLQYSEFLLALFEWLSGPGPEHRLRQWKRVMAGAPATRLPGLECRTDAIRSIDALSFIVEEPLRSAIGQVAAGAKVTVAELVLAANFVTLAALSGCNDVVTVAIVSGRDNPALLGLVGSTVDCTPVRVRLSGEMTFSSVMKLAQANYAWSQEYRVPWTLLMRTLRESHIVCAAPIFNFITGKKLWRRPPASFLNADATEVGGIRFRRAQETASADWKAHQLDVLDCGSSMAITLKFDPVVYTRGTVEEFRGTFVHCLEAMVRDPQQTIGPVPLG